ncbi:MAG: glycosyltransferase [Desulfobacteraceae bacterium]|nr:MAG: glycosyltransferase [Desulfobacteraceae bacterium]
MKVSVVIPVYKAENFIQQAVESALTQPETGEVILVEDNSPDNSLQICRNLADEQENVKLLTHKDGKNHGAGASRNLGIMAAKNDYVAFLDADDFFLPSRFVTTKQLFDTDHSLECVCEAVGSHFETAEAEQKWKQLNRPLITTIKQQLTSHELFLAHIGNINVGYFHTAGWVVKKNVFQKTGLFDEHLRLHQDTALFIRLTAVCKTRQGSVDEPVAMRRVHVHNRITAERPALQVYENKLHMWITLWQWFKKYTGENHQQLLLSSFLRHAEMPAMASTNHLFNAFQSIRQLTKLSIQCQGLIQEKLYRTAYLKQLRSVFDLTVYSTMISIRDRIVRKHKVK